MRFTSILCIVALLGVIACAEASATPEPTLLHLETPVPSPTAPIISTLTPKPTPTQSLKTTPTQTPRSSPTSMPAPSPTHTAFPTPTPIPELWESFYNPEYGYNIKFPTNWITITISPDLIVTDPNTSALFWVVALKYKEDESLDIEADNWLLRKDTIPGSVQRYAIVINSLPALRVSYVRKGPTRNEHENVAFVPDGSHVFILLGTVCEDDVDISQETIHAIQNSFIAPEFDPTSTLTPQPTLRPTSVPTATTTPTPIPTAASTPIPTNEPSSRSLYDPPDDLFLPFRVEDLGGSNEFISPFGIVRHSRDGGLGHGGIDIPLNDRALIFAVADGTILSAEESSDGAGGLDVKLLILAHMF